MTDECGAWSLKGRVFDDFENASQLGRIRVLSPEQLRLRLELEPKVLEAQMLCRRTSFMSTVFSMHLVVDRTCWRGPVFLFVQTWVIADAFVTGHTSRPSGTVERKIGPRARLRFLRITVPFGVVGLCSPRNSQ